MAKKKVTHQDKPPQTQEQTHQTIAMDDASEKLENMKSLNSMLLKETFERRQQVDSLLQSKGSLELELTRSQMEKEDLQTELTRLHEQSVKMELERNVVFEFASVQVKQKAEVIEKERDEFAREKAGIEEMVESLEREMREMVREKSEIEKVKSERESEIGFLKKRLIELVVEIDNEREVSSRVGREKDEIRTELDLQIKEANELILKLVEAENREMKIQEEIEKLRAEYSVVMEEKEVRDTRIVSIMRDKDSIERSLGEANRVIGDLKRDIERIVREKEGIEDERNVEVKKRTELENVVTELKEMVLGLQKEEKKLQLSIAEMEKSCVESEEKRKQLEMEIGALLKEKDETFEGLIEENRCLMIDVEVTSKLLHNQRESFAKIVAEKIEIEEAKVRKENENSELEKEVDKLRNNTLALEETIEVQVEKIQELQSDISRSKDSLGRIIIERDEALEGLNEEKKNGINLKAKLMELEKKISETEGELGKIKGENFDILGEKKDLESHFSMLKEDKALLEKKLLETQKGFDDKKAKVEISDANLKLALKMLKNTVGLVNVSKDKMGVLDDNELVNEEKIGEEIKPYVEELDAIKTAFKNRDTKLDDMKREVEFLKNSTADAHKKKNFWTLVSSATTIFAAASVAYVARGR